MLRVSKVPPGDPTTEDSVGQNRFQCLTCPYHFVINKRYYERKYMKRKEVEDIMGGKGAWDNVDKTEGAFHKSRVEEPWGAREWKLDMRAWKIVRRLTMQQCNVRTRSAGTTQPTGISYRFGVLMNL
jgi:hypothetical protein